MPETIVMEFQEFHSLLTRIPDYSPFYFALEPGDKNPLPGRSWKLSKLCLNEAIDLMSLGFNIGIAGTDKDKLVIIDVDDESAICDIKPSLCVRSRKRTGLHYFYFTNDQKAKVNIPTENVGEIRSVWQYVVATGSYVKSDPKILENKKVARPDLLGMYTLEKRMFPVEITFSEFPRVFRDAYSERKSKELKKPVISREKRDKSGLFDLRMNDILGVRNVRERFPSVFHGSDTGKNTSVSNGYLHCWRHNVSHTPLTVLAVMAGIYDCVDAGYGHINSGVGSSCINFRDARTLQAIKEFAIKEGLI